MTKGAEGVFFATQSDPRRCEMRRLLAVSLSLLPALAFAANPVTLESRSAQHALSVEVNPVGNYVEYAVRVTDLSSGEVLASPRMVLEKGKAESVTEVR